MAPEPLLRLVPKPLSPTTYKADSGLSHTGGAATPSSNRVVGPRKPPNCLLVISPDDVGEAVVAV